MRRICMLVVLWMFASVCAHAQSTTSITINASGAASLASNGTSPNIATGYGRLSGDGITPLPAGQAVFGFSTNGALISETAVPGTTPIVGGRIYAEVGGSVNTGLAIANPNNQPATISFFFTDLNGTDSPTSMMTLAANRQIAQFLDQPPFNASAPFRGTFTFQSSPVPVAAIVLRGFTNERSEFLMTSLPVADLNGAAQNQPILFPHYADGGGWTTQIILVNPTQFSMNGSIQFFGQISTGATSDSFTPNPSTPGVFNYSIPPRSSRRFQSGGAGDSAHSSSIQVTPTNNSGVPSTVSITPSGVAIFSYNKSGITITQAGVPPVNAATGFRIYAEASGDFNGSKPASVQSGVAIANPSNFTDTVNFELRSLDGSSVLAGSLDIVANGQKAIFLTQIPGFEHLQVPFKGVLRVFVLPGPGIAVIGLRGRYNERGDLLLATTPPVAENSSTPAQYFFPHLADGGGYSTQFILLNTDTQNSRTATLNLLTPTGDALPLQLSRAN